MSYAGRDFIRDSSSSQRRAAAISAGKTLLQVNLCCRVSVKFIIPLKAVAHFLILADSIDVALIIEGVDKAFVRHPESDEARQNRDYAQVEAVSTLNAIDAILRGEQPDMSFTSQGRLGQLITELDQFQNRVYLEPGTYKAHVHRPELEELLERIVSGSAAIADSGSTRADRKQKIVNECNNLRQALQDLLGEYEKSGN
ncbi:hypothetical protein TELCIR_05165 [Teladorsagia circumcincta]|uniref:Uncharacterized protein n=1 Tax=Teladorsagia circumcincta TaxID=45464 RepID=A0A2G9UT15_TELCI|nr:hypothetical protein TELCIR_05165 [Teladorsagia circumcincta]